MVGLPLKKFFGKIASALEARRQRRERRAALSELHEDLRRESKYLKGVVREYVSEGGQWRGRLREKFGLTNKEISAFLSATALLSGHQGGLPTAKTVRLDFRIKRVLNRLPEGEHETLLGYVSHLKLVKAHQLPKWRALRDAIAERRKRVYKQLQEARGKERLLKLKK